MPRPLAEASLPSLPSATEDPVERRRLLNILAQRRYRNRKRVRLASLESQLKAQPIEANSWLEIDFQSQPLDGSVPSTSTESTNFQTFTSADMIDYDVIPSQPALSDPFSFAVSLFPNPDGSTDFVQSQSQSQSTSSTSMTFSTEPLKPQSEPLQGKPSEEDALLTSQEDLCENTTSSAISYATYPISNQILDHAWDDIPPDNTEPDPLSFNDEAFVTTPGLSVIRAHVTILQRMHRNASQIDVWDPFSISPFYQPHTPSAPPAPDSLAATLPDNYHPTALQKAVKHHPILDLLPWPSVRSRILHILTLPQEVRPERARGDMPTVTMQLMFDMKDAGGGLRVWGSNPFDEDNWEVGPVFFQKWWWALSSEIVRRSNQIRTQRGEDVLRLKEVSS